MSDVLLLPLKLSLVIFVAGNLLDMGLKLSPQAVLAGLRNVRFVALTLIWGFVLGPALAYAITVLVPLDAPYATGLILMGMAPCAPFLPAIIGRAGGDLGFTAAFMLLTSVVMVAFMPIALPLMAEGLSVGGWTIAKPLLLAILLPLAVGMGLLQTLPGVAARLRPIVKWTTGIATIALVVLCLLVYGPELLGVRGSLAIVSQLLFFLVMTTLPYWLGFGLPHAQKIVLSVGMATRNLGAALAPLFAIPGMDQRSILMVVLGLPMMVAFAWLATRWFAPPSQVTHSVKTLP